MKLDDVAQGNAVGGSETGNRDVRVVVDPVVAAAREDGRSNPDVGDVVAAGGGVDLFADCAVGECAARGQGEEVEVAELDIPTRNSPVCIDDAAR